MFYDPVRRHEARAICWDCPVLDECRAYVLTWEPRYRNVGMVAGGIWHPSRPYKYRPKKRRPAPPEGQDALL